MVSEKKKQIAQKLAEEIKKYSVIGILDMHKLPSRQLQEIRESLRGKALIKMAKKSTIKFAIEYSGIEELKKLESLLQNQPALLLSNINPFELARIIDASKSFAPAKAGDIAPKDIVVTQGPTNLKPGPVLGELQRVKLPVGVEGDKIVIKKDTVLVKQGEEITKPIADVLIKLGVEPIEISLNLLAVYDNGMIYGKDVLFVPLERYQNDLQIAYRNAVAIALEIGLITQET
ncbi:MAG: 50S ribosomal protein L10, partial [Candidatus Aenigmatarchaeota archaeon]